MAEKLEKQTKKQGNNWKNQPTKAKKQVAAKSSSKSKANTSKKATNAGKKPVKRTNTQKKKEAKKVYPHKLKIFALGGLNEIGKNMTVLECGEDIIIVDCGIGFPDDDMLGVDLVIPDFTYIQNNIHKVRGVFLTHGHEDHIGSLPYF